MRQSATASSSFAVRLFHLLSLANGTRATGCAAHAIVRSLVSLKRT
jgi:hypothetical protein